MPASGNHYAPAPLGRNCKNRNTEFLIFQIGKVFSKIINYGVRAIIILIGILLLSGIIDPPEQDTSFIRIMGVIFILFGLYRIIIYHSQLKRYRRMDDKE